jgi:hypothetical protein
VWGIVVPGLAGRLPCGERRGPPADAVDSAEGAAGRAQGSVRSDPAASWAAKNQCGSDQVGNGLQQAEPQ